MRPKRYKNTGTSPRDQEAIVQVIWDNGQPARQTYMVKQLCWERDGKRREIDIFWRADGLGEMEEE